IKANQIDHPLYTLYQAFSNELLGVDLGGPLEQFIKSLEIGNNPLLETIAQVLKEKFKIPTTLPSPLDIDLYLAEESSAFISKILEKLFTSYMRSSKDPTLSNEEIIFFRK